MTVFFFRLDAIWQRRYKGFMAREVKLLNCALLCILLPCLLFCPGCMTARNFNAAQRKPYKVAQDKIDRIDSVWLTSDHQLLVFLEAHLTNSPRSGLYTLKLPLSKARMHTPIYPWDTNCVMDGELYLSHDVFCEGWALRERAGKDWKPVPAGLQLVISGAGPLGMENVEKYKPLPGETRSLYPIVASSGGVTPTEFIYVDTARPESFTYIRVEPVTLFTEGKRARYLLTPLTVAGDLATSPFQLLFLLYVAAGGFVG